MAEINKRLWAHAQSATASRCVVPQGEGGRQAKEKDERGGEARGTVNGQGGNYMRLVVLAWHALKPHCVEATRGGFGLLLLLSSSSFSGVLFSLLSGWWYLMAAAATYAQPGDI